MTQQQTNNNFWLDAEMAWDKYCMDPTPLNWQNYLRKRRILQRSDEEYKQEKLKKQGESN